jgi:hypothetical protein
MVVNYFGLGGIMITVQNWINHLHWEIDNINTNINHNNKMLIPIYTLLFASFLFLVNSLLVSDYINSLFGLIGMIIGFYGVNLKIDANTKLENQIDDMQYLLNYILLRKKRITVNNIKDCYFQILIKHDPDISENKKEKILANLKQIRTKRP